MQTVGHEGQIAAELNVGSYNDGPAAAKVHQWGNRWSSHKVKVCTSVNGNISVLFSCFSYSDYDNARHSCKEKLGERYMTTPCTIFTIFLLSLKLA